MQSNGSNGSHTQSVFHHEIIKAEVITSRYNDDLSEFGKGSSVDK